MSHNVDNISSENAGVVMYRNVRDTIRTHFAETNGAGAFLEAPLQAYYGMQGSIPTQVLHVYCFCSQVFLICYVCMQVRTTIK